MPLSGDRRLSPQRRKELQRFEKAAGLRFKKPELLDRALTHRSSTSESSAALPNNERLEFLGDSVLGLSVAAWLYQELPTKSEGDMARIKSFVVSEECLAGVAGRLGIADHLLLGRGEELSGGRSKKAIIADALEAVFGALYLDSGFEPARKTVLRLLVPEIRAVLEHRHRKDFKTLIQEFVQKSGRMVPRYSIVRKEGPDHDRTFWIALSIGERSFPPVSGKSRKEAEQAAAQAAYQAILEDGGPEAQRLADMERD